MTLNGRLRSRKKKAFTLIELLVVIAIIALLLSILMPALNAVKEQARAIVCAAHLKQWGVILSFFAADSDDRFPDVDYNDDGNPDPRGQWWFVPMMPYFEEQPDILICGKAKIKQDINSSAPWVADGRYFPQKSDEAWGREITNPSHPAYEEWVWSSYGPNAWLMDPSDKDNPINGRWPGVPLSVPDSSFWGKFSTITTPSRVPFYLDSRHVDSWAHDTDTPASAEYAYDGGGAMETFTLLRHNKSNDIVFGDGAVGRTDLKDLWGIKWHRTFNTRNAYADGTLTFPGWMR